MIKELHSLPILARVLLLQCSCLYKSQQGLAPRYLCELMSKPLSARSSRRLRSADRCDLVPPPVHMRPPEPDPLPPLRVDVINGWPLLYCIVFIHFYSASHNLSLSEALPTTAIDTVSEFTRRSATGNCR